MSLDKFLQLSRAFPPGYLNSSNWPKTCGYHRPDQTYDPPRYEIPLHLRDRLLGYFEEDIYFSLKTDYIMPKKEEDGVVKVKNSIYLDNLRSLTNDFSISTNL